MQAALQLARPWGSVDGSGSDGSSSSDAADQAAVTQPAAGQSLPQQQEQQAQQTDAARRFCYSNVSARVWWFDRQLTAALARPSQPRQVVVLGAGLDCRPWRMALPPGVRWWELDMPHVVAAKRHQLEQLGAALSAAAPAAHAHPLCAAAWQAVAADLGRPGWGEALLAAGLDASRPVVWVAEGKAGPVGWGEGWRAGNEAFWLLGCRAVCVQAACTCRNERRAVLATSSSRTTKLAD